MAFSKPPQCWVFASVQLGLWRTREPTLNRGGMGSDLAERELEFHRPLKEIIIVRYIVVTLLRRLTKLLAVSVNTSATCHVTEFSFEFALPFNRRVQFAKHRDTVPDIGS